LSFQFFFFFQSGAGPAIDIIPVSGPPFRDWRTVEGDARVSNWRSFFCKLYLLCDWQRLDGLSSFPKARAHPVPRRSYPNAKSRRARPRARVRMHRAFAKRSLHSNHYTAPRPTGLADRSRLFSSENAPRTEPRAREKKRFCFLDTKLRWQSTRILDLEDESEVSIDRDRLRFRDERARSNSPRDFARRDDSTGVLFIIVVFATLLIIV